MEYGHPAPSWHVPAQRQAGDFEFATQFKLPIRQVVAVAGETLPIVSENGVLMELGAV